MVQLVGRRLPSLSELLFVSREPGGKVVQPIGQNSSDLDHFACCKRDRHHGKVVAVVVAVVGVKLLQLLLDVLLDVSDFLLDKGSAVTFLS